MSHGIEVPNEQALIRLQALFCRQRVTAVVHREADWLFTLENDRWLRTDSNWRLLARDRLRMCADDDGQWFGLPAPFDVGARFMAAVGGCSVVVVRLGLRVPDLLLELEGDHLLEVPLDSCGYEAWEAGQVGGERWIAGGGGVLWRHEP